MNSLIEPIVIGLLQGILEWLPISSQGNLVIYLITFLGYKETETLNTAIFLHLGTGLAALLYFRKDVVNIIIAEKKEYDVLFSKDNIDEIACNVQDAYMEAIKEFTGFYIHGYGEVAYVLKALKEDPKSIVGISKKVLNNKK